MVGEDCNGVCGGTAEEDCSGECNGDAVVDECGECGGDGIADGACDCSGSVVDACGVCGGDSTDPDACGVPVYYSSSEDFGGFQFSVEGVSVVGASGGVAEDSGFTVSTSSTTVLGFSFSGSTVSSGNGLLTFLETADGATEGCLYDVIVSSPDGGNYSVEVENCNVLVIEGGFVEPVYGLSLIHI